MHKTTNFLPPSSVPAGYSGSQSTVPLSSSLIRQSYLTTVFTPPASCGNRLYTSWEVRSSTTLATHNAIYDPQCYPNAYVGELSTINEIYSPGVCPKSWVPAASAVVSKVTTVACCPENFTYLNTQWCGSLGTTSTIVAIASDANQSIAAPWIALDYHIVVAWASSDLRLFTPASAPILAYVNATTTSTLPPLETATPRHTSSTASSSRPAQTVYIGKPLSGGGIAGIVIAVIAFAVLFITATTISVFWRRERRKRIAQDAEIQTLLSKQEEKRGVGKDGYPEIDGIPLVELDHKNSTRPPSPHLTEIPASIRSESLSSIPRSPIREEEHEK